MFDAIISFITWPFVTVFCYVRFTLGALVAFPALLFKVVKDGYSSIANHCALYAFLKTLPLGIYTYSGLTGFFAPYSGSVNPIVTRFTMSECEVTMNDHAWLRNPFQSIHALALANLGELSSGMLMVSNIQQHRSVVGIPVRISSQYFKKARGKITAKCKLDSFGALIRDKPKETEVHAELLDETMSVVARTTVTWSFRYKDDVGSTASTGVSRKLD